MDADSFTALALRVIAGEAAADERRALEAELSSAPSRREEFEQLKLTHELEQTDWVNNPAIFSEQLSAHLWATHQIDSFSNTAVDYMKKVIDSAPDPPLPTHRLGIALIGQGVAKNEGYRLFRKLRPHGVYYTQVKRADTATLLNAVKARADAHPAPYGHWYIDGGASLAAPSLTSISYSALSAVRAAIQARMQRTYEAPVFDPEAFRTMLAQLKPEDAGLAASGDNVLTRFQLSLLTEGAGTQVFSTTFVQWAAREALRRAQPLTLGAETCDELQRVDVPFVEPSPSKITGSGNAELIVFVRSADERHAAGIGEAGAQRVIDDECFGGSPANVHA